MSIVLFTTKNKQNPQPCSAFKQKEPSRGMNQRQVMFLPYGLKHGMCSGIAVSCFEKTARWDDSGRKEQRANISIGARGKMQNEQTAWEPECVISSEGSRYSTYLCNLHCELQLLTHHIVNLRYHMPGFIWIQHRECTLCVSFSMFCRVDVCFHDILLFFATCSTRSRHISKGTYPKRPYMFDML